MKKKVIRLTESDIENMVKKIIKEEKISAQQLFNNIIDMSGSDINEEIFDIIHENNWSIPEDVSEVASMLVDTIISVYELPYPKELLEKARPSLITKFKRLIVSEKDMYQ